MKTIRNMFLVIALTTSFAFADDGHTGSGNRCDTCPPPPCTENCGGFAADDSNVVSESGSGSEDEGTSLIEYWTKIFFDVIG